MRLKLIMLWTLLFISTLSFGQKVFNSNYKLEKESLKMALVPILNEYNSFNDTIMLKIFSKDSENVELVSPTKTRKILSANLKAQEILDKIIMTDYKKKELKKYPNLNTILDNSEIDYLKKALEEPDFILIPIAFNFKAIGIHTFGYCKFRYYNLNTGEFIFEFSENMNVNMSGEKGIKGLTGALLSVLKDYYKKKFLKI